MKRTLASHIVFVALPIAVLLSGCGGGSSGFVNPTATATPSGNFDLSVFNSADSNWGLSSFSSQNVTTYTGRATHDLYYISLAAILTGEDGTTHKVTLRLAKQDTPFAAGDSFSIGSSSSGFGPDFTAQRTPPNSVRPLFWRSQPGAGTATIAALSRTSVAVQVKDVIVKGDLYGATGTLTFNGTMQGQGDFFSG